jgi:aerobic carbon-monoxide dehydrogenase medium subunit
MLRPFRLLQPETIEEASKEAARLGDDAAIYAGGAELLLLMRHGLVEPDYLIDIKKIPELGALTYENGALAVGANVTHAELERDGAVLECFPLLAEAESHVGNVRVRNQGTLGGNLCFADPHSDPPTALLIHEATVQLQSVYGTRCMPIDEFIVGTYETALRPGEILGGVRVPSLPAEWGWAYRRIERFYRPTLNVAAAARSSGGIVHDARLAVGCVGPTSTRLTELEEKIRGQTLHEACAEIAEAATYLRELLDPVDDLLGPADYKLEITVVLLRRALRAAVGGNAHA